MLVIGLTGSIAMGKSTVADYLRRSGLPVCDADAIVHELYRRGAVADIERAFPGTTGQEGVDRQRLSQILTADPAALKTLEAIVHPLVRARECEFLRTAQASGARAAVLEVPLLFEVGTNRMVDIVMVVSARPEIQKERVMERPGMTEEKLKLILSRQMPDAEKRAKADFVIDTSGSFEETYKQVDQVLQALDGMSPQAYEKYWA